jgi:hypothetical protein
VLTKKLQQSSVATRMLPPLTLDDAARFYAKVERHGHGGHWIWTAGTRDGYGAFSVKGKTYAAHRVAFALAHGYDPGPKKVLHRCDIRRCVHPRHTIPGTQRDNVDDMLVKNRHAYGARNGTRVHPERVARGERAGSAKLSESEVRAIRRRVATGEPLTLIATDFGVHKSTVSRIASGKHWSHL